MIMRAERVILFISIFLCVSFNTASGAILPADLIKFHIIGNGTHLYSFDFRIDNIEFDGIHLGSITTLRRHDNGSFPMFGNGGQLIYTHNGIRVNVTSGRAALSFTGNAGQVVTLASWAGNTFEFEPESVTINASGTNKKDVVVLMDGVEYHIPPGKRTQIVEIEIIQETKSQHSKQNIQGNTPVVIFGSAHLDVSTIDIGSLRIGSLAMRMKEKAHNFSTILHVNYDKYPDLVVMFDDISQFLYKDNSYATLKGNLSDGTIINGKDNISISN
jgi:hypothetical protein